MSTNPPTPIPSPAVGPEGHVPTIDPQSLVAAALEEIGDKEDLGLQDIEATLSKKGISLTEDVLVSALEGLGYEINVVDPPKEEPAPTKKKGESGAAPHPKRPALRELKSELRARVKELYDNKMPPALAQELDVISDKIASIHATVKGRPQTKGGSKKTPEERAQLEALQAEVETLHRTFMEHTPQLKEFVKVAVKKPRATLSKTAATALAPAASTPATKTGGSSKRGRESELRVAPALSEDDKEFLRGKGWSDADFEAHTKAHPSLEFLLTERERLTRQIATLESKGTLFKGEEWLLQNNLKPNLAEINNILGRREKILGSDANTPIHTPVSTSPTTPQGAVASSASHSTYPASAYEDDNSPSPLSIPFEETPAEKDYRLNDLEARGAFDADYTPRERNTFGEDEPIAPEAIGELAALHQKRLSLQQLISNTEDIDAKDLFRQDLEKVEAEIATRMGSRALTNAYQEGAEIENKTLEPTLEEKVRAVDTLSASRYDKNIEAGWTFDSARTRELKQSIEKDEAAIAKLMADPKVAGEVEDEARFRNEYLYSTPTTTPPEHMTYSGQRQERINGLLKDAYTALAAEIILEKGEKITGDVPALIEILIGLARETKDAGIIARNATIVTEARMLFDKDPHDARTLTLLKNELAELELDLAVTSDPVPAIPNDPDSHETAALSPEAAAAYEALIRAEADAADMRKSYFSKWEKYGKGWLLDPIEKWGRAYNKAGLSYKLALSATLIGAAITGGPAIAGALGAIGLTQRTLGTLGTYVSIQALLNSYREKRIVSGKGENEITRQSPKLVSAVLAVFLGAAAGPAFSKLLVVGQEQLGSYVTSPEVRDKLASFLKGQYMDAVFAGDDKKFNFTKAASAATLESAPAETPTVNGGAKSAPMTPPSPTTHTPVAATPPVGTGSAVAETVKTFTDAIDKPGDSVWRSMKEILRDNAEEFGWKENNITSKELWLDRRVAEILQNNPDIAGQNLVHEGGVVHLEKSADGSIKAFYEAAPGFEDAPKDLPEKVSKTPLPEAPSEAPKHIPVQSPEGEPPVIIHPKEVPDAPSNTDTQVELPGTDITPSVSEEVTIFEREDVPSTLTASAERMEEMLPKLELAKVTSEVRARIDAEFGKPSFFGFGGVHGTNTPEWLLLKSTIPASELLAAPNFNALNMRFKELVPNLDPHIYEKAHKLILEVSRISGTIPVSTEDPESFITRSIREQFIKHKHIA